MRPNKIFLPILFLPFLNYGQNHCACWDSLFSDQATSYQRAFRQMEAAYIAEGYLANNFPEAYVELAQAIIDSNRFFPLGVNYHPLLASGFADCFVNNRCQIHPHPKLRTFYQQHFKPQASAQETFRAFLNNFSASDFEELAVRHFFLTFYWAAAQPAPPVVFQVFTPGYPDHDLFLAGDFNQWQPGLNNYRLERRKDFYEISLKGLSGTIEFKITGESWAQAEGKENGAPINNRRATLKPGDTLRLHIAGWEKASAHPASTRSAHLQILDSAFYLPKLGKHRRIWLYFPPGYQDDSARYPVWYFHDGQNLFDEATANFGVEWRLDEQLDSLASQGYAVPIVVALDHGGPDRVRELSFKPNERFGTQPQGPAYLNDLVETLKPHIDSAYRTLPGREHTLIAGSSLGGLMSLYALNEYPEVFSAALVFSPAYWYNPDIFELIEQSDEKRRWWVYQLAGGQETARGDSLALLEQCRRIDRTLKKRLPGRVKSELRFDPAGEHNERFWQRELTRAILWFDPMFREAKP